MPGTVKEVALAELAACSPAELCRVARLREVHARCSTAGVLDAGYGGSFSAASHAGGASAAGAGNGAADVGKLHALFDAAVRHGMPQLVCHYVDEVCSLDDFSSPDGVEVRPSNSPRTPPLPLGTSHTLYKNVQTAPSVTGIAAVCSPRLTSHICRLRSPLPPCPGIRACLHPHAHGPHLPRTSHRRIPRYKLTQTLRCFLGLAQAYLQDGEMVAEWATAALRSAETALDHAAMLRSAAAAEDVDRAAAVFEALRDVLCALGADPAAEESGGGGGGGGVVGASTAFGGGGGGAPAGFHARLQAAHDDAARRMQHAQALAWVLREGLGGAGGGGGGGLDRFGGPAAWAGSVQVRRTAAAAAATAAGLPPAADAGVLFLDDLLAGVGVHPPPYPFKSAAEAAERVFRDGSAAPGALVAKQSLFLYYLLDAGMPPDGAPSRYARTARMHPRLYSEVRAASLLDDWEHDESLEEACRLLPRAAHPALPLRFVAALAARRRPADALAVARARQPPGMGVGAVSAGLGAGNGYDAEEAAQAAAAEAELGVAVRLECGLATEAFLVARDAVASQPPVRRGAAAAALVARLASHAAAAGVLFSVLELPFQAGISPLNSRQYSPHVVDPRVLRVK